MSALLLLLALQAPGDRLFAVGAPSLRRAPESQAAVVRQLRAGDELVELDPPVDELTGHGIPSGWCVVQTVDVPSERSFTGFLQHKEVVLEPPLPERRSAVLRQALDEAISGLEARAKPFADLRGQVLAWRARLGHAEGAPAQVQGLSDRLARYMEAEITPRAMDVQDWLAELREIEEPGSPGVVRLARRFGKAAAAFKP